MKVIYSNKKVFFLLLTVFIFLFGYFAGRFSNLSRTTIGPLAKEMPIFFIKKNAPQICLTFDISWGEKTLPLVLKVLTENQVRATFFCSGPWAVTHPELIKNIYMSGHEIASHGDRHINLSEYPKETVHGNILKAQQDLLSVVERIVPYFRPPNGDYDDVVIDTARELGFETIIWSIDSLDWKNPGPEYMVDRVLKRAFSGAIVLCHASDSSKQIDMALPGIINGLRAKGFKLVPLSELFAQGSPARNDPR